MKKIVIDKQIILEKWANLLFAVLTLSAVLASLTLIWFNK